MRYQVATICMDQDGKWSIDIPNWRDGTFETVDVGAGLLPETLDYLRAVLDATTTDTIKHITKKEKERATKLDR